MDGSFTAHARSRRLRRSLTRKTRPIAVRAAGSHETTSTTLCPASTARTASNRCSTTDNTTNAIPGPRPVTTPPQRTSTTQNAETGPDCRTSPGAEMSHIRWHKTCTVCTGTADSGSYGSRAASGRLAPTNGCVSSLRCGPRRSSELVGFGRLAPSTTWRKGQHRRRHSYLGRPSFVDSFGGTVRMHIAVNDSRCDRNHGLPPDARRRR